MPAKLAFAVAVVVLGLPLPLQSHDLYSDLTDSKGERCCDDRDCRPAPYRFISGHWQMFVDRRWIDVPDQIIQYRAIPDDTGETDGGHWCGFATTPPSEEDREPVYTTRCAILPPQAGSNQVEWLGVAERE